MHDFFISSRWRNRDQILHLLQELRKKGKSVYCFLENTHTVADISKDPEQEMKKFEAMENWQENSNVRKIFETDMEGLRDAKTFILLLPAGKSCHIEAGIAYGMGKSCVLIGEQQETESLYFIFEKQYKTIEEFMRNIL